MAQLLSLHLCTIATYNKAGSPICGIIYDLFISLPHYFTLYPFNAATIADFILASQYCTMYKKPPIRILKTFVQFS